LGLFVDALKVLVIIVESLLDDSFARGKCLTGFASLNRNSLIRRFAPLRKKFGAFVPNGGSKEQAASLGIMEKNRAVG
jgi:hypothetical protein